MLDFFFFFPLRGVNVQLSVRHEEVSLAPILQPGWGHRLSTGFPPAPHPLKKKKKKSPCCW